MKIELLAKTSDALKVAFTAIRTCYSPLEQIEVWNAEYDKYMAKNDDHIRLVKQIVSHGHTSTLEHVNFTFAVSGVSRALLAQLTRHRIGFAYSVQSQRYVREREMFDFITPPSIEDTAEYDKIMEEIYLGYKKLLDLGVKPEDARFVLPNAATTNITMTLNLRAFLDFYSKRNENTHAQWEIAGFAEELKRKIVEAEPWVATLMEA